MLKLKILTAVKMNLQTNEHYCYDPMFADSVAFCCNSDSHGKTTC